MTWVERARPAISSAPRDTVIEPLKGMNPEETQTCVRTVISSNPGKAGAAGETVTVLK
jgi:hypothetical protein